MPALLFSAALAAAAQPSGEAVRWTDSAAPVRMSVVQDLSAVVSGTAPFASPVGGAGLAGGARTGPVTLNQAGAGMASTSVDTGMGSVTQAATAVSARIVLPDLAAWRTSPR